MIAEIRLRCQRAIEFATISPAVLWTLLKARRRLGRNGLEAAVDAATGVRRRSHAEAPSLCAQRLRWGREDEVICWWLVTLRVRAICLYRSLVMLEHLSAQPHVQMVELVIGVRRGEVGGLERAHSWLLVNGKLFRTGPGIWEEYEVLCRFVRQPGRAAAPVPRVGGLRAEPPRDAME